MEIPESKSASTFSGRSPDACVRPRIPTSIAIWRSEHFAKLYLANLSSLSDPGNRSRRNDSSGIPPSLQLAPPLRRRRFRSRKETKTAEEAVKNPSDNYLDGRVACSDRGPVPEVWRDLL